MMNKFNFNTVFVSKEGYSFSADRISAAKRFGNVYTVKDNNLSGVSENFKKGDVVIIISSVLEKSSMLSFLIEAHAKGFYTVLILAAYNGKSNELIPSDIKNFAGASIPVLPNEIMPILSMLGALCASASFDKQTLIEALGEGNMLFFASSRGEDLNLLRKDVSRTLMLKNPGYLNRRHALVGILASRDTDNAVFEKTFESFKNNYPDIRALTFGGKTNMEGMEYYVLCR